MTLSKTGKAASEYANAYSIPVFPLWPKSKNPMTTHGFHDATTDQEQIAKWWASKPNANVAGAMGDGIICIDFDVDENGAYNALDWLSDWESENGKLPETATAITGRGGMHIFYRVDRDIKKSENCELHIDIRGSGSYAMLAPSVHPNGNTVYWDLDPDDYGIAEANDLVYKLIDDVRPKVKRGERAVIPVDKLKAGEGRNNFLYKQGCSVRAKGADDETVASVLLALNRSKCSPPLPDDELQKTIRSVCSVEPGLSEEAKETQKQAKRGRPRKFEHNKVARKLIDEYGVCLIDGEAPAIRDGGRYRVGWDAIDSVVIDMHDDCTVTNRKEVKAYIQAKAETRKQSSPYLIAFTNGILDVRTMELRDWRDDDLIPNVIPHRWNPKAKSDVLYKVLDKMACGDVSTCLNLAEFIGVCMVRSAKLCPFFPVLIGVGSNGKSTYIELLKDVVGSENISGLQPKEITAHFLGTHIVGKTANLGDDISSGYLDDRDCAVIKSVATGDLMFTDVKGGKGFHFQPYCTMVFSCNQFPRLADTTPGFMRRLFPIEFNAVFSPADDDYDPMIGEKLREEETLEYACVLGVEGLRRVIANHQPTPNELSEAMKSDIAREANTAMQWFHDDNITADYLCGMIKEEVYDQYTKWCERNGYSRTALGSGALVAQIGTMYKVKLTKIAHREYADGRKTVREFEKVVPNVPDKTPGE